MPNMLCHRCSDVCRQEAGSMAIGFCLSQLCSTTGVMTLSTLSAVNREMCLYQSALFMTVVGTVDTVV